MSRLKRQIIVLTLCLGAVLAARVYVARFLATRPPVDEQGEVAQQPAAAPPEAPVSGEAGGTTVEMPAAKAESAGEVTQSGDKGDAQSADPAASTSTRQSDIATKP